MFNATRDQICISALRKVGALGEDESPNTLMLDGAVFMLNSIIKEAQTDGMPLWAIEDLVIPCSSFVNAEYSFTMEEDAPLKVLQGMIRDNKDPSHPVEIPMVVLTKYDYNRLPNKLDIGMPIQYHHNVGSRLGSVVVWPAPDSYSKQNRQVILTVQRKLDDLGGATSEVDFPSYWNRALVYQLAWSLAPDYGLPVNDRQILAKEADIMWTRALSFGTEEGSLFLTVDSQFTG